VRFNVRIRFISYRLSYSKVVSPSARGTIVLVESGVVESGSMGISASTSARLSSYDILGSIFSTNRNSYVRCFPFKTSYAYMSPSFRLRALALAFALPARYISLKLY